MTEAVQFESSHASGDFAGGRLTFAIARPDAARGVTVWDRVWFSVPADFHTHHDSVAAALMTLVGRNYPVVSFNFPISLYCAELLTRYYRLEVIGPIDESQEPRRPGRYVGLNLSGGCDSAALWCLLTDDLRLEFRTITSQYDGRFSHEASGYERFPRDVTCATNLRALSYDRQGRFHAAVPLLYADYLNLRGLASGHTVRHTTGDLAEFRAGTTPSFVAREATYGAGGLEELHLCRGVHSLGMLRILLQARPDLTESAARASGPLSAGKALEKAYMMRWLCAEHGWPAPAWLSRQQVPAPAKSSMPPRPSVRLMFVAKHFGIDVAERIAPGVSQIDLTILDGISLAFLGRHHPGYVPYMPHDLRQPLLAAFAHYGIEQYDADDATEMELLEGFIDNLRRHEQR